MGDIDNHNQTIRTVTYNCDSNISDSAVEIIDSKARLIYRDFIGRRVVVSSIFFTCLGLFISCISALSTASSFNSILGINGAVVEALFIIVAVGSGLCGLISLVFWIISLVKYGENRFIKELHNKGETRKSIGYAVIDTSEDELV